MIALRKRPAHPANLVAGVDEVGRGPLAGPVVAAAVILNPARPVPGLKDSKQLSAQRRSALATEISTSALAWSVAWSDAAEIDCLNILQATLLAMRRAVFGLHIKPCCLEIDGNCLPRLDFYGSQIRGVAIIGGDSSNASISAASIIAKVHRDRLMLGLDALYPGYGFGQHKGYGTVAHREKLGRLGPCPQHRRSFKPVSVFFRNQ